MRRILALAWNVIRTELADRSSLVFLLILPLAFTYVIGLAMGGNYQPDPNADTRHPVVVVDEDLSSLSEQLISVMEESETIRPVPRDRARAAELLADQQISAYVIISEGFANNIISGESATVELISAAGDNYALATGQAIRAATAKLNAALSATRQVTDIQVNLQLASVSYAQLFDENLAHAAEISAQAPIEVSRTSPANDTTVAIGFAQTSPGQLVTWVLITLIGSSVVIVGERLGGTLNRLMAAPMRKGELLTGIIMGRMTLGLVQMLILIGFGALVLGVNWGHSYMALAIISFSFALASVSLGLLIGVLARTTSQAREITTAISMILAALGGAWWPIEITPQLYQTIVKILPTTWAMQAYTDVIVRQQAIAGILTESLVLTGFAILFFMFSIKRFRYE